MEGGLFGKKKKSKKSSESSSKKFKKETPKEKTPKKETPKKETPKKCGWLSPKPQKNLYQETLRETTKSEFVTKMGKKIMKARDEELGNLKKKLEDFSDHSSI